MEAVIKMFAAKKCPIQKSWFGLKYDNPKVFYNPQWRLPVWVFLSYRVLATCYVVAYFLFALVRGIRNDGSRHFIQLSTWETLAFDCYFGVALANLVVSLRKDHLERLRREQEEKRQRKFFQRIAKRFRKKPKEEPEDKKDEEDETPLSYKIQWFLFNTTVPMSILVTIIYWTTLYMTPDDPDLLTEVNIHAITMVLSFVELFITATPVRFWHFIYPIAFDLAFDFFTVIYWACGGTNTEGDPFILPFLDYGNEPGTAGGVSLGMIISLLVLQGIMYGFYRLRIWMASKCGMNPDLAASEKDGFVQGLVESPC